MHGADDTPVLNEFLECWFCGRTMGQGEPFVSVDYHIERMDQPDEIMVERAVALLVACQDHAPSFRDLIGVLRGAGYPVLVGDDDL